MPHNKMANAGCQAQIGRSKPEWQSDGIEAQSLLAVDDCGEVSNLAKVPGVGIVGIQPINHSGPNLKSKPVETLQSRFVRVYFPSDYTAGNLQTLQLAD